MDKLSSSFLNQSNRKRIYSFLIMFSLLLLSSDSPYEFVIRTQKCFYHHIRLIKCNIIMCDYYQLYVRPLIILSMFKILKAWTFLAKINLARTRPLAYLQKNDNQT